MMKLTMENLREVLAMIATGEQEKKNRFFKVLMDNRAMNRFEVRTICNALRDLYGVDAYGENVFWNYQHFVEAAK